MSQDNTPELTMPYILKALEGITHDNAYLCEAIAALQAMKSDPAFADNSQGDNAGAEKAKAIAEIVRLRETTNQQMIALYTQMYTDLAKQSN